MAGYHTIEALRPILHRGPPPTPVVDAALVGRVPDKRQAKLSLYVYSGRRNRIAPDVVAEIVRRRAEGESYGAIVAATGTAQATVIKYCRHVPLPDGKKLTAWDNTGRPRRRYNMTKAWRMRRAGFTYAEIGEELGCFERTAWNLLNDGGKTRPMPGLTARMVPKVAEISGFSCKQIRRGEFSRGGRSHAELSKARHILFWLLRNYLPDTSYPKIGASLGGFDHTSCMHGVRRAQQVADKLGITASIHPKTAARQLWAAEWPRMSR